MEADEKGIAGGGESVIVQYWHSEELPEEIAVLIETFRKSNPGMRHLLFCEASAEDFIVEHYTDREVAAFRACAIPAMQADYFRYCALLQLGGFYVDADLRCIAPLSTMLGAGESAIMFGLARLPPKWQTPAFQWRERVGAYRAVQNGLFAVRSPGHPLLEITLETATANIEARIADDVAIVTGPAIFTSLYLLRELGSIESFLDYSKGGVIQHSAPILCKVVGTYDRLKMAFDGVRIPPMSESHTWATGPKTPPAYKKTDHWSDVTTGIFKTKHEQN